MGTAYSKEERRKLNEAISNTCDFKLGTKVLSMCHQQGTRGKKNGEPGILS